MKFVISCLLSKDIVYVIISSEQKNEGCLRSSYFSEMNGGTMRRTYTYKQKTLQFFAVLLPIFITQLSIVSIGFFDTIMSGHAGEQELAGVAIATNLFFPFFNSSLGIISGLTPSIAHLYGADEKGKIRFIVQQGFYWALCLALIFIIAGFALVTLLVPILSLEPRVNYVFTHFLLAIAFGICPIFLLMHLVLPDLLCVLRYALFPSIFF